MVEVASHQSPLVGEQRRRYTV